MHNYCNYLNTSNWKINGRKFIWLNKEKNTVKYVASLGTDLNSKPTTEWPSLLHHSKVRIPTELS